MDIDPLSIQENQNHTEHQGNTGNSGLNTMVAITVALLATFTGICKIKDDNICQAMQQSQADKLDHWSFYQARNIRQEIDQAALTELTEAAGKEHTPEQTAAIQRYETRIAEQQAKKNELKLQALEDQSTYESLNYRDDQFDLSDAAIALSISLLAITALTQKRWLLWLSMVPTSCGVLMGMAGLCGWKIHPEMLTRLFS